MKPAFTFEKTTQRYRYTSGDRNGQFVSFDAIHKLTGAYQAQQQAEGQGITQRLLDGELNTNGWMREIAAHLRASHINMHALGYGGHGRLTAKEYSSIGGRLRYEYTKLREFAQAIQSGELSEKQIKARIDLYYASTWRTYENARQRAHKNEGFRWERRLLAATGKSCADCVGYSNQGWVAIGKLPVPGTGSTCMANCRCWKEYESGNDQPQNSLLDNSFGWIGNMPTKTPQETNIDKAIALIQQFNPMMSPEAIRAGLEQLSDQEPLMYPAKNSGYIDDEAGTATVMQTGEEQADIGIEGMYWGKPRAEDLELIEYHTGHRWSAEDWHVVPMRASDNLMWRSWQVCWHPSVLLAMADQYPGQSLLVNHNAWEIEDTKGFFLRSAIAQGSRVPADILESHGNGEYNRDRVAKQGWIQLYLLAAIPANEESLIYALKTRQIQDVSTGSILKDATYYCPHCSQQRGRDVAFDEKDADGEYICPHEIPHPYLKMLAEMGWMDEDVQFADYAICAAKDGQTHYETSLVGMGNLPGAEVLRRLSRQRGIE